MADIEYFYCAHSVFAYLGSKAVMEVAARTGRKLVHRPFDLKRGMAGAKSTPSAERTDAQRAYYFGREIERWTELRNVPCLPTAPPSHWNDYTTANRLLIAASQTEQGADALAHALLSGHWVDSADLADRGTLHRFAKTAGHNADALLAAADSDAMAAAYEANTNEAIARSVFGSPTYFVDGDMFYGQDHLEMVERALKQPYAGDWPLKHDA